MKIRAALAVVAVAAAALSTACSVAGSASPGMTPSAAGTPASAPQESAGAPRQPSSATPATSRALGAPITVLPPHTVVTAPSTMPPSTTAPPTTPPAASNSAASTAETSATAAPSTTAGTESTAPTSVRAPAPSGTVVVIDPGHNGGNASHPEIINKQVPAGFGQHKACNTTGTATDAGYPEHRFNWQVALKLRDILQDNGITVLMTRDSDDGVGPCVNERAAVGNDANAAAVISIHGDGEAAGITGFFVMTASRPPAGADIAAATDDLAADIRDGMVASGFPVSSALGSSGLWARSDLGGLNLSLRPTVMIECGNMRNAGEATTMSGAAGQQQYAEAIAAGVLTFLAR